MANKTKHNCIECGKERNISSGMLRLIVRKINSGACKSCSGKKKLYADYDRSLYQGKLYRAWFNMKTRCNNKKSPMYYRYGGRGITYTPKWENFSGFLDDMQKGHKNGLSLERIDNDKGYSKENCKWATPTEQANNTRRIQESKKYVIGDKILRISEIAKILNIKRTTLDMRLNKYGWTLSEAITNKPK